MQRAMLLLLMAALLAAAMYGLSAPQAQISTVKAPRPIAVSSGGAVSISWRLPASPRTLNVIVYRADAGGAFLRLATVEAERRSYTDGGVAVGQSYDYAIALDQRGLPLSQMSESTRVSVGATDRIVFRGGSITRGVFEVSAYLENRRVVESFVAAPGETVGDLRKVEGAEKPVDFRLGCKLVSLKLEIAAGRSTERQAVQDARGAPLRDLAGRAIELSWPTRSETRERVVAEVQTSSGKNVTLREGEGFSP